MSNLPSDLASGIRLNRAGGGFAFASVCSAHPDVLHASLELALERDFPIIIEATSNQVNQFGGYTGMTPEDFIRFVSEIAGKVGYPVSRIIFGGDHLGPQAWRDRPADEAMVLAEDMVRAYVRAGFTKIHLDCSEGCAGEPAQLADAVVAERAARLAKACEAEAGGGADRLNYVVGTEVPPPGGARGEGEAIEPTAPSAARETLEVHRRAFEQSGLQHAWKRVIGLVVQPGVEFGPNHIDHLDITRPDQLSPVLDAFPTLSFEAHSTDYQQPAVFSELGRRHFAVLKVGPALTFAYREAIYALSHIDGWLNGTQHISVLMENLMLEEPKYWSKHYHADNDATLRLLRHFSYADRIRYYWATPAARQAVAALSERLAKTGDFLIPLIEQYFPNDEISSALVRTGNLSENLVLQHIKSKLAPYLLELYH